VERARPAPGFDDKLAAGAAASEHAASLGVTSIQDMSADHDLDVYQSLLESDRLKTRIYGMWPLPKWGALAAKGIRGKNGNSMIRTGGLKGFSDGSLGSTTALFFEPYADAPAFHGLPAPEMLPEGAMFERVLGADRMGFHLMIHAIGDKANDQVLTIFEQASATNPKRERRHRIEHAQHLRPQDIPRFARAGVIASMQPYHCADDGCWAERRIGPKRCKTTYAFRSLLHAGATLAFGSDWPVAPLNPILGVAAAVTRRTLDGQHPGGWYPEQKISVEEAVRAYTVGAAHAELEDNNKGAVAPRMLADLVMLDRDIFMCEPGEIEKARVVLTIMDGRVVHEAHSLH
jgi:predicted amidohydrolase YtcJ